MTVWIDGSEFIESMHTLEGAIYNAAAQALRASIKDTVDHAKATTMFKDRSRVTRGSVNGVANGLEGQVSAGGASKWIEDGTDPHEIKAKRGGALRFEVGGEVRFAKRVHHPGTKSLPFMTEARDFGERSLEYGIEYLLDEAIKRSK